MQSEAPFYQMKLSDEEQQLIDKAISLLLPYNKEKISHYTYYFGTVVDEEYNEIEEGQFDDHDCCDNEECWEATLKELQALNPNKKIGYRYYGNDGDHENIERCSKCSRPLTQSLTWIRQELEHHEQYLSKELLKDSANAYDLIILLEAMPSHDENPSPHSIINRLEESLADQQRFIDRVLNVCKQVIAVLED